MQQCSQAVDIRLRRCQLAKLLWCSVPNRSIGNRILRLSRFEEACNAKVDQVYLPGWSAHNIGGFEIAENDWWSMTVQVMQHMAELHRSEEHTSELQSRLHLVCRLLLEKKNLIFSFANSP